MIKSPRSKPLNPKEAAEFLGKPVGTLNNWRWAGRGPAYIKVGHAVRYLEEDLVRFIEANRVEPSLEAAR